MTFVRVAAPFQVEMNTIAASFGCLSKKVGDLHRFVLARNADAPALAALLRETAPTLAPAAAAAAAPMEPSSTGFGSGSDSAASAIKALAARIPVNRSMSMLAVALAMAHYLYGDTSAVVVFVVQPGERNIADQRALEVGGFGPPGNR